MKGEEGLAPTRPLGKERPGGKPQRRVGGNGSKIAACAERKEKGRLAVASAY